MFNAGGFRFPARSATKHTKLSVPLNHKFKYLEKSHIKMSLKEQDSNITTVFKVYSEKKPPVIHQRPFSNVNFQQIKLLVFGEIILAFIAAAIGSYFKINVLHYFTVLSFKHIALGMLSSIPLLIVGNWVDNSNNILFAELNRDTQLNILSLFGRKQRLLLVSTISFCLAVSAALGEELLFRGVLLPLSENLTKSSIIGLLISSFLFGFGHSLKLDMALCLEILLGLCFGYMYQATNALLVPVLAHFLYDFFTFIQLHIRVTDQVTQIESSTKELIGMIRSRPEISQKVKLLQDTHQFSEGFLARCITVFAYLDMDGNGRIDENELWLGYKTFGRRLSRRQAHDIMLQADKDKNGFLDAGEFVGLVIDAHFKEEKDNGLVGFIFADRKTPKPFFPNYE